MNTPLPFPPAIDNTRSPCHMFGTTWQFCRFDLAHVALGIAYAALASYAGLILVRLMLGKASLIRWQKLFMWLCLAGSIGRSVWSLLAVPVRESMMKLPSHTMFLLNSLPAFLFFMCYVIVLFLWAELILTAGRKHDLRDPSLRIRELRPVFYTVWGLIWLSIVVLYTLDFVAFKAHTLAVSVHTNLAEMTLIVFISLLYLASAAGFLFIGSRFYLELHRAGTSMFSVQSRRQRIILEVQLITAVLTFCFLLRAALTIWQIFSTVAISSYWYTDLLYFTFLELIPIGVLVVILRPRTVLPTYDAVRSSAFSPIINQAYA